MHDSNVLQQAKFLHGRSLTSQFLRIEFALASYPNSHRLSFYFLWIKCLILSNHQLLRNPPLETQSPPFPPYLLQSLPIFSLPSTLLISWPPILLTITAISQPPSLLAIWWSATIEFGLDIFQPDITTQSYNSKPNATVRLTAVLTSRISPFLTPILMPISSGRLVGVSDFAIS